MDEIKIDIKEIRIDWYMSTLTIGQKKYIGFGKTKAVAVERVKQEYESYCFACRRYLSESERQKEKCYSCGFNFK